MDYIYDPDPDQKSLLECILTLDWMGVIAWTWRKLPFEIKFYVWATIFTILVILLLSCCCCAICMCWPCCGLAIWWKKKRQRNRAPSLSHPSASAPALMTA